MGSFCSQSHMMKSFLSVLGLLVAVQAEADPAQFFYTSQFAPGQPEPTLAVRTLIEPHMISAPQPVAVSGPITYMLPEFEQKNTVSSQKEVAHWVFQLFDLNCDGQVTAYEMSIGFASVGFAQITEEHIATVFPTYDKDQDNQLNIFEFMPIYEDYADNRRSQRLLSGGFQRLGFQISVQKNAMTNHQAFQRHTDTETVHLAFQLLDLNGDGQLKVDEMKVGFSSVGYESTEEDIQAEMPQIDLNDDNQINIFEFMQRRNGAFSGALTSFISKNSQNSGCQDTEPMHQSFQFTDLDGNGLITVHEMKIVSASTGFDVTEEELLASMPYFDVDGDNMLNIVEWIAMLPEVNVRGQTAFSGFLTRLNSYIPVQGNQSVRPVFDL